MTDTNVIDLFPKPDREAELMEQIAAIACERDQLRRIVYGKTRVEIYCAALTGVLSQLSVSRIVDISSGRESVIVESVRPGVKEAIASACIGHADTGIKALGLKSVDNSEPGES